MSTLKISRKSAILRSVCTATLLGGLSTFTPTAFAADDDAAPLEEVMVTGSRIKRTDGTNSPTPVSVLSSIDIANSGDLNIVDILRDMPSIGLSVYANNNPFNFENNGLNAVNLRNLGEQRALVLVDGRRRVSSVPGESIVDFNAIPTDFIERVEVVTGGASAVYGSEAISGVINVILKDSFDGFKISAQTGVSDKGDGQTYRLSGTWGSDFADGRGSVIANITWDKDEGVYSRDRDFSRTDSCDNGWL